MRQVTVAAIQMTCTSDRMTNIAAAEKRVREAAARGAGIVLLQELFETPYFCQVERPEFFELASEVDRNPAVLHFARLARELEIVLPISFFERRHQAHYNSVAVIDADGSLLGVYRKTHIPDGPGYEEKFYFTPGASAREMASSSNARASTNSPSLGRRSTRCLSSACGSKRAVSSSEVGVADPAFLSRWARWLRPQKGCSWSLYALACYAV